jgi:hypothetical protein
MADRNEQRRQFTEEVIAAAREHLPLEYRVMDRDELQRLADRDELPFEVRMILLGKPE